MEYKKRRNVYWVYILTSSHDLNVHNVVFVCVQGKQAVLMSVITGDAVAAVRDMEDKEVVDECMKVLRELFKEQVMLSQGAVTDDDE